MKKVFASFIAAVLLLLTGCAYADIPSLGDLNKLTTDELSALLNRTRQVLRTKIDKIQNGAYLVKNSELEIYTTGKGQKQIWDGSFDLEVVFVNHSDIDLCVSFDHIVINGWEVDHRTQFGPIGPDKKTKDYIRLKYTEADLEDYKGMEELEFSFHTYKDGTYKHINEYKNIRIDFHGESWN